MKALLIKLQVQKLTKLPMNTPHLASLFHVVKGAGPGIVIA
jgi:hypothetical protein